MKDHPASLHCGHQLPSLQMPRVTTGAAGFAEEEAVRDSRVKRLLTDLCAPGDGGGGGPDPRRRCQL